MRFAKLLERCKGYTTEQDLMEIVKKEWRK